MTREDIPFRALQAKIFQDLIARHRGHALLVNVTGAFLPGPGAPITPEAQAEQQGHPVVLRRVWLTAAEQKELKKTGEYQAITETKVTPTEDDEHAR